MSQRKVHSQGYIPFSWEAKAGVSKSKVSHYDQCPTGIGSYALDQTAPPSDNAGGSLTKILVHEKKVPPPPPCSIQLPPKRSTSVKGLRLWWWHEDPFLAAYKECTKSRGNGKLSSEGRKNGGSMFFMKKKKKITFSCKENSSDVRDDNLVKLSNLPPLPKGRIRGREEHIEPLDEYW